MPVRDRYVIGRLGSYPAATVAAVDLAIRSLTAQIPDATPQHKRRLWDDIDRLLSRRLEMTAACG